jgi:hypothetical protein
LNLDLNKLPGKVSVTFSPEEHEKDADLRRFKERCLFVLTLAMVVFAFGVSVFFMFTDRTPESQRYSWSAFSLIIGGLVGRNLPK